ncbi:MAG: nucleotide exchange factor GrpE [Alphaproteobacteria bacterium]|nr:nucleotide exchange factor GrpE [Alphaproteobacteria bacterium]
MKKDNKEDFAEEIKEEEISAETTLNAEQETSKEQETSLESENENETRIEVDVEALQEENKKLREDYLRAFADAENTKKRALQEIEKNNKFAISSFAKNLLSVADNMQRAVNSVSEDASEECQNLLKGVELTQNELAKVFEKFSIKKMEILDTIFDPNFHQVVQEVEDKTKPAGTIIAELQSGYMINDRILREAIVVVTK